MAKAKTKNDILTIISIATFGFILLGITIAVVEWHSYSGEPPPPVLSVQFVDNPELVTGSAKSTPRPDEEAPEAEKPDISEEAPEF